MSMHVMHMAIMGLLVSVAAPLILIALTRTAPELEPWTVPAAVAFPGFVALHAAATLNGQWDLLPHVPGSAAHMALLIGAVFFWAPVVGIRRRLPEGLRAVYLYAAMPMLDLAGVWLVAVGDVAGGLAMITGMLPMGLVAAAITWRWITDEERRTVLAEASRLPMGPREHTTGGSN